MVLINTYHYWPLCLFKHVFFCVKYLKTTADCHPRTCESKFSNQSDPLLTVVWDRKRNRWRHREQRAHASHRCSGLHRAQLLYHIVTSDWQWPTAQYPRTNMNKHMGRTCTIMFQATLCWRPKSTGIYFKKVGFIHWIKLVNVMRMTHFHFLYCCIVWLKASEQSLLMSRYKHLD